MQSVLEASSQQFLSDCWQATLPAPYLGFRGNIKHPLGEALPKQGSQPSSGGFICKRSCCTSIKVHNLLHQARFA